MSRDASMTVDSGDEAGGKLHGRVRVIRELHDQLARYPDASFLTAHVNGRAGLALRRSTGEVVAVLSVDGATSIERLWLCTSPRKLASWNCR